MKWIPKFVYEALPYIWVSVGISAIYILDDFIATASGMILGGAGVVIFCMRNKYRKGK